jgi:hypothetical protein
MALVESILFIVKTAPRPGKRWIGSPGNFDPTMPRTTAVSQSAIGKEILGVSHAEILVRNQKEDVPCFYQGTCPVCFGSEAPRQAKRHWSENIWRFGRPEHSSQG